MKAKDFIQTIEYAKAFKDKPKRTKKEPDNLDRQLLMLLLSKDESSVTDLLHKEAERAQSFLEFMKNYEKAHKKEDKKPEGMSTFQLASLFMVFALIAPLYLKLLVGH